VENGAAASSTDGNFVMSIKKVTAHLRQVPSGASRECVFVVETLNLGTPDEALSPIIRMNYDIEDQADDFPDGEYVVNYGGHRGSFTASKIHSGTVPAVLN
jgi:hypothetical protein